jgi:hypothetical protein
VESVGRLRADHTLITTGEADVWAGPDDLGALAAALPGCMTHVVPGAHHHDVWNIGGDAYLARVRRFIDEHVR